MRGRRACGLAAVGLLGLGARQSLAEPGTEADPSEPTEGEWMPEPSGGWTGGSDDTGVEVPVPVPECFALVHTLVPDSEQCRGDTALGYRVRLGELDGVAPAELVSAWGSDRAV